jgi:hypothetical protein
MTAQIAAVIAAVAALVAAFFAFRAMRLCARLEVSLGVPSSSLESKVRFLQGVTSVK